MSNKQIAIQQIMHDSDGHLCCICYKFRDNDAEVVEKHCEDAHSEILSMIDKVQSN